MPGAVLAQQMAVRSRGLRVNTGTGAALGTAHSGGGSGSSGGSGSGSGGSGGGSAIDLVARAQAAAAYSLAANAVASGDIAEEVFDGTLIDLEDRDGTLGETSGTLVFGWDGTAARPLRTTYYGMVVDQGTTTQLLAETYRLLKQIAEKLGNAGI